MLTTKEVLYTNYLLAKIKDCPKGVRDLNFLKAALLRPFSLFQGKEPYPSPYAKAAALSQFIIKSKPFKSANTATAMALGLLLLKKNGLVFRGTPQEVVSVGKAAAAGSIDLEGLTAWFEKAFLKRED